jgi:chemotaxis protein CheD
MSESESKIIDVNMSDMKTATNPYMLRSSGIGSCIVITLYDPVMKIGAMAHPMLARQENKKTPKENELSTGQAIKQESNLRFVDSAIEAMIKELEKLGAHKSRLEAKLFGGASMFKVFDENPNSIGIHNSETAHKIFESEGIKIVANDTGGNVGRSVAFELATGLVEVKTKI